MVIDVFASPQKEFESAKRDTGSDVAAAILVLAGQFVRVCENLEVIAKSLQRLSEVADNAVELQRA